MSLKKQVKRWRPLDHTSSWRRISLGMWDPPGDPTIYGHETLIVDDLLEYLDEVTLHSGVKITMTAFIVHMIAQALHRHPQLNVVIINGRVLQREHVDVFCQVAINQDDERAGDLSGITLRDADQLDLVQIARLLQEKAGRVRMGQDREIERQKSMIDRIPRLLLRRVVKIVDFLTFNLPVDLDRVGVRSDPFGSCMVSNIAPFDLRLGLAPLVPASRCPLALLPAAVFEDVRAVDGKAKVCKVMQMSLTADHRVFDGQQLGYVVRHIRRYIQEVRDALPDPVSFSHHKTAVAAASASIQA